MSAGSSPTGGVGGLFYAILLLVGVILKRDKQVLRSNSGIILPVVLGLVFVLIIAINILVINRYVDLSQSFDILHSIPQVLTQPMD
ncbi:MAG: hypothetical protein OEL77_08185 [Nitrosopumilus sp.]|nr:hypothetical protein [Nitrosopumilus sp.]MDH3385975.1 hypothetical protein [Nitrosopumilus sp.]